MGKSPQVLNEPAFGFPKKHGFCGLTSKVSSFCLPHIFPTQVKGSQEVEARSGCCNQWREPRTRVKRSKRPGKRKKDTKARQSVLELPKEAHGNQRNVPKEKTNETKGISKPNGELQETKLFSVWDLKPSARSGCCRQRLRLWIPERTQENMYRRFL